MMVRSQITLEEEMQRKARERAAQLGISLAEYIRRLVSRDLGETTQAADPALVFNLGASGGSDVARDRDTMLAEAISAQRLAR